MARALSVACLLLSLLVSVDSALADTRVFALIVASNRGTSLAQAPLAYADDDGARYLQLFAAALTSLDDARLLTTFDDATRAAYPLLVDKVRPPVEAELALAVDELAARVRGARDEGHETVLYFVFAGHGEARDGRGYLGLEDKAIDGDFIEHALLERIPASTKHVILDSCNSFFVVNPRKPGGRRWATPDDMAFGFSARHPEVGVFLSTNAEAEVYEWSRLESGVFSHEVRSGLRGAADVDGDGVVSYAELAGFVTRANEGISRESLRPHLFFRGPQGNKDAALFDVSALRGGRLALGSSAGRAWVADARGERVLDLHREPGDLTIVLPTDQGELSLTTVDPQNPSEPSRTYAVDVSAEGLIMRDVASESAARGQRLFGDLFSRPYGPAAFAEFERQQREQPRRIFGLSESDTERADHLLEEIAGASRVTRLRHAWVATSAALFLTSTSALLVGLQRSDPPLTAAVVLGGLGIGVGTLSAALLRRPSLGERMHSALHAQLSAGADAQQRAFVTASEELTRLERRLRRRRRITAGLLLLPALSFSGAAVGFFRDSAVRQFGPVVTAEALLFIGAAAYAAFVPSTEERLIRIYRRDPQLSLQLSASASGSGGMVGLRTQF